MRTSISGMTLLIGILLCVAMGAPSEGQVYAWRPADRPALQMRIRRFEGHPGLVITDDHDSLSIPGLVRFRAGRYDYVLRAKGEGYFSRDDHEFDSDRERFYGRPYDPNVLAPLAMDASRAQEIAEEFARSHYPEPDLLKLHGTVPRWGDQPQPTDARFVKEYVFMFVEALPGSDVLAPGFCRVGVDTVQGQIVEYTCRRYPVLTSTDHRLSGEQAMAAAMVNLGIQDGVPDQVECLEISTPDDFGIERLGYTMRFFGTLPGSSGPSHFTAFVDANTGAVLEMAILHDSVRIPNKSSIPPHFVATRNTLALRGIAPVSALAVKQDGKIVHPNCPPVLIQNIPFFQTNYLCVGLPNACVKTAGRPNTITISGKARKIVISCTSASYSINRKQCKASAKPVKIGAEYFVPLDVFAAVAPMTVKYDAASRTVSIDAVPAKPTPAATK